VYFVAAKLLGTVEMARQTMVRLEELMRDTSRLHQTPALMRRLLLVTHFPVLDILLFFCREQFLFY
jgi:hypothetical protein